MEYIFYKNKKAPRRSLKLSRDKCALQN
jgi:hypothetical protein